VNDRIKFKVRSFEQPWVVLESSIEAFSDVLYGDFVIQRDVAADVDVDHLDVPLYKQIAQAEK
jgi:hypothetical protein